MAVFVLKESFCDFEMENFMDWAFNPSANVISGPCTTFYGYSSSMTLQVQPARFTSTNEIRFSVLNGQYGTYKADLCLMVGNKEIILEKSNVQVNIGSGYQQGQGNYSQFGGQQGLGYQQGQGNGQSWSLSSEALKQNPGKFLDKGRARIRMKYSVDPDNMKPKPEDESVDQLAQDLEKALLVPNFSDVTLTCGSSDIPAHKVLLTSRSKVFEAMFHHKDTRESRSSRVNIEDITTEALKSMVKFIYTNKVSDDEITTDLLMAADKYDIGPLAKRCDDNLSDKVSVETVVDFFMAAYLHGAKELKQTCLKLIVENFKTLKANKELDEVANKYPQAMLEITEFSCSLNQRK